MFPDQLDATASWTTQAQRVLVRHDLVSIPGPGATGARPAGPDAARSARAEPDAARAKLATVAANLTYYGFALSAAAYAALARVGDEDLELWWLELEPVLAALTGDDKRMDRFVVYKNFPAEVLAMDDVDYWLRQILMYWGLPNEIVTEEERGRAPLAEAPPPRVLQEAGADALRRIRTGLFAVPARWIDDQWEDMEFLATAVDGPVELASVRFVENRIRLAALLCRHAVVSTVDNATDALRLAVALSDGDIALRERHLLRRFTRKERRFLLGLLEGAANLADDVARRREQFKRLLHALHPGDYAVAYPRVVEVYDALYRGAPLPGFNADVERLLAAADPAALGLLASRPGEFARRLRVLLLTFGRAAVEAFGPVAGRLRTVQLLKLRGHLATVNDRRWRMFPPRGDWSRVQVVPVHGMRRLPSGLRNALLATIDAQLAGRLATTGPVALSSTVDRVKLPTNDAELAPYGRGTVFPIPPDVTFVRTASYWKSGPTSHNVWYDNGWNFFDADWSPVGDCCWNAVKFGGGNRSTPGAVFSGDPTNSKDLEGRACQLVDLYLDRLPELRARYAVWSVLCYSRIMFSAAEEVLAALQWGRDAQRGKLFEPSRCQLAFALTGNCYTKFVAYVDVARRELVYLDANLPVSVSSAALNGPRLAITMPAYVEYLGSLPSVHDLYRHAPAAEDGMPVVYDDAGLRITGGRAYVFRPSNPANEFESVDPAALL